VFAACLLALAARQLHASPESWPEFRGPTGQGISLATNVPITWSSSNNVAWKVALPGNGWSSPVLSENRLFITAAVPNPDGASVSLHAFCLDADDGAIIWDQEVFAPDSSQAGLKHDKNSQSSPTPILDGDRLYVHFGHLGTAALDLSGNVIWRQTGVKYTPVHGNGGSPALVNDELVFSCDGRTNPFVVALDTRNGDIRWQVPRDSSAVRKFSFCTPLVIDLNDAQQVILPGSGYVGAYDPADGCEIWRVRYGEGFSVVPRPVYAHGLLFITTGFETANLLAIDPLGAGGDVTGSHIKWTCRHGVPTTPSLLATGNELYFVSDGGVASCLDAMTGNTIWNERLGGDFSASPIAAEGRIYFLDESGVGYVLRGGHKFELLAKNDLGERTLASYAVADNALFIRSEFHLWRIGSDTNKSGAGQSGGI